jgi:hypothetical protein
VLTFLSSRIPSAIDTARFRADIASVIRNINIRRHFIL